MSSLQWALFIICAFAIFKSGESLRCWTCSSDADGNCADHFNTTTHSRYSSYQNYPNYGGGNANQVILQECDQGTGSNFYPGHSPQRAVCMKKKQTTYQRTMYVRQCRYISYDARVGSCPTETTSSTTSIDFCEFCDYDGCNGAPAMSVSFIAATLLPVLSMLFMRK